MLTPQQIKTAEIARILTPLLGARSAQERAANIVAGGPETLSEISEMIYRGEVAAKRRGWPWKAPSPGNVRIAAVEILQVLS